ncbi:diacylglycerol kinase family protein [soil metagenome]
MISDRDLQHGDAVPCLLVNPRSFAASRGLADKMIATATAHGADVVVIHDRQSLADAMTTILSRRQAQVMLFGGDGTVRGVIEHLANLPAGSWMPDLAVLPGGRTNLIAADLGMRGRRPLATMKRALLRAKTRNWHDYVSERPVLCIEQAASQTRFGFFMGAAWIDSAVRRCDVHRGLGVGPWYQGPYSSLFCVATMFYRAALGRPVFDSVDLQVEMDGTRSTSGRVRLLYATTLLHERGMLNPYARSGQGDLRLTSIASRAVGFWRLLPRVVVGRFSASMTKETGYLSGHGERMTITGLKSFSLDGEPFEVDPTLPVTIRTGPRLRFVTS